MSVSYTIAVPQELLEKKEFRDGNKTMQDNMALFCTAVLRKGGVDSVERNFQQIGAGYLSRLVRNTTVKRTKELLLKSKVIETDKKYSIRGKGPTRAFGFRFSEAVSPDDFVVYDVRTKPANQRVTKLASEEKPPEQKITGKVNDVHTRMANMMKLMHVNMHEANRVIRALPIYKRPSTEAQVRSFLQRRFYACVGNTGRFYSNIANMRKEIRAIMFTKNSLQNSIELVTPDVSCCQPVLLNCLLKNQISGSEFNKHKELTEGGQLYEAIANDLGLSRNKVKASFVKFLCGPAFRKKSDKDIQKRAAHLRPIEQVLNRIGEWYEENLPEVLQFLNTTKRDPKNIDELNKGKSGKGKPPYEVDPIYWTSGLGRGISCEC